MKKRILALSLLLVCAGSAMAQKKATPAKKPATTVSKTGSNTFSCTINGKPYTATGSKMFILARLKTYKNPPFTSIMIFSQPQGLHYSLEFQLPPGGGLAPGDYPLGTIDALDARFPAAYFSVTDERTKDIKLYDHMEEGGSGTVTITSVAGGVVEGTFAFHLSGGSDGEMEITNGSFHFKMPPVRTE